MEAKDGREGGWFMEAYMLERRPYDGGGKGSLRGDKGGVRRVVGCVKTTLRRRMGQWRLLDDRGSRVKRSKGMHTYTHKSDRT